MPPLTQTYPVLIVGYGYAGQRFARALRWLGEQGGERFALAGICDVADGARAAAEPVQVFRDLEEAVVAVRPAAVVVAVNEEQHVDVLHGLAAHCPLVVMCEKPLTATLAEAETLPSAVTTNLTVNFVERHSPVLDSYFAWAEEQRGLHPIRVDFWWGKHRAGDMRPTMGVLSELTHPVDLIDHLFGFERFEFVHAHGLSSDFSPHRERLLDTVTFLAFADDYAVAGSSSFVWPRRARTITALLRDNDEHIFRLTLDFDMPRWDCDRLLLQEVDATSGRREPLLAVATGNSLFPAQLHGVGKLARFVRESVELARTGVCDRRLAGYEQALKIQALLERLEAHVGEDAVTSMTLLGPPAEMLSA